MKGLGKGLTVRSKEPWQVCVAGTGTALGSPSLSLCKGSSFRPGRPKAFGLCPTTSFPKGLAGEVVTPYGSGAVLQVMVALGCSLPLSQRGCVLLACTQLFPLFMSWTGLLSSQEEKVLI